MRISNDGIAKLYELEGCKYVAYQCSAGVWTIGPGFTKGVKQGDTITQAQCDARLRKEIAEYEIAVWVATGGNVTQPEFDALVLLGWNIGIAGLKGSSVIRAHNRGDKPAAARAFGLWNKVNGKVNKGLSRRRSIEAAIYLTPEANAPKALMPQIVDAPKALTSSTTVVAGGTAAVATAAQIADAVSQLKYSVAGLEAWLVPALAVVALIAIGWVIRERYMNRERGAI